MQFEPVPASLFAEPLYNADLKVFGKAWQHEYVPNMPGAQNVRDAGALAITYDQATGNYLVDAPLAGSGTLMRASEYDLTGSGFSADPSNSNPTSYCCNSLGISAADRPASEYRYVTFANLYATQPFDQRLDTIAYGAFAIAQPTRTGDVPTSGAARYTGSLLGFFGGDAAATWLGGTAKFDFDFASGNLSGDLTTSMNCFMGCSYGTVIYTFADTIYASGSNGFSGSLVTPGTSSKGDFFGVFAGPAASELAAQFQLPFFNPEYQRWMTASGAIAAKRN